MRSYTTELSASSGLCMSIEALTLCGKKSLPKTAVILIPTLLFCVVCLNAIDIPCRALIPGEDYTLSFADDHPFSPSKSLGINFGDVTSFNSLFSDDHPFSPPKSMPAAKINHGDEEDDASLVPSLLSGTMDATFDDSHISTSFPTELPTKIPSNWPTHIPTKHPTSKPTIAPSQQPTQKWSNSPKKIRSEQKKRTKMKVSDEQLLQTALMEQTNETLIKFYFFPNFSNIDLLTRFQNHLICKNRFDLILLTCLDYSDPKFEHNLNWISKDNPRVKEYHGDHHKLCMTIHEFINILDSIFISEKENDSVAIQKINDWFISVVRAFHLFEFVDESDELLCLHALFLIFHRWLMRELRIC